MIATRARESGKSMEFAIILAVVGVVAAVLIPNLQRNPEWIRPVLYVGGGLVVLFAGRVGIGYALFRRSLRKWIRGVAEGKLDLAEIFQLSHALGNATNVDALVLEHPAFIRKVTEVGAVREALFDSFAFAAGPQARPLLRTAVLKNLAVFEEPRFARVASLFIDYSSEADGATDAYAAMLPRASAETRASLLSRLLSHGPEHKGPQWIARWKPVVAPYMSDFDTSRHAYSDLILQLRA